MDPFGALMGMMGGGRRQAQDAAAPPTPKIIAWASDSPSVDTLASVLEDGNDLNEVDASGRTALHHLAEAREDKWESSAACASSLMSLGADPGKLDPFGRSPLTIASAQGAIDLVLAFLGADRSLMELRDVNGMTPIHFAARARNAGGVLGLLLSEEDGEEAARKVSIADEDGFTAMHWAAFHGDRESVDILLSKGASLVAMSKDGKTPFEVASIRNHSELAEYLLTKASE